MRGAFRALILSAVMCFASTGAQAEMFGSNETESSNTSSFTKWKGVVSRHKNEVASGGIEVIRWKNEISRFRALTTDADKIVAVNSYVNSRISYKYDRDIYNQDDYWASPAETFARGQGDCDDYAIAKYFILKELGFSEDDMRLVVLKDTRKNEIHAVLSVKVDGGYYILDNQFKDVMADTQLVSAYQPIYSINQNKWWRHT